MFHCQCIHLSIDVEESEKIDNKTGKQTGHVVRFGAIIYSDLVHSLAGQEFSCDCYDARWMWIDTPCYSSHGDTWKFYLYNFT